MANMALVSEKIMSTASRRAAGAAVVPAIRSTSTRTHKSIAAGGRPLEALPNVEPP
jgi:hypothetical protein